MDEGLQAQHIYAGYGRRDVLQDVSFSLDRGELCALLGPNGCGKSTLLRAVCALLPYRGSFVLDGAPLQQMTRRQRARQIGYLSQHGQVSLSLSAMDVVLMGYNPVLGLLDRPNRAQQTHALDIMEQVGAAGFQHRDFQTLSEGERQLVLLSRALLGQAKLLVLDEPDSALDFQHRRQLLNHLKHRSQQLGQCILWCSHDVNVALGYADSVLLLKDGALSGKFPLASTPKQRLEQELTQLYGPVSLVEHGQRYLMTEVTAP